MMEINYPSTGYIHNANLLVRKREEIRVIVKPGSRKSMLLSLLPLLLEQGPSDHRIDAIGATKNWKAAFYMFPLIRFITVHYCALSVGYRVNYTNEADLIVVYSPS